MVQDKSLGLACDFILNHFVELRIIQASSWLSKVVRNITEKSA